MALKHESLKTDAFQGEEGGNRDKGAITQCNLNHSQYFFRAMLSAFISQVYCSKCSAYCCPLLYS